MKILFFERIPIYFALPLNKPLQSRATFKPWEGHKAQYTHLSITRGCHLPIKQGKSITLNVVDKLLVKPGKSFSFKVMISRQIYNFSNVFEQVVVFVIWAYC